MAQRAKRSAKRMPTPIRRSMRERMGDQAADAYYRELQTLHDVSQAVLASLDIHTILERILDKALLAGSFDVGVIRLLDSSGGANLRPVAHRGYRDPANVHTKTTTPGDAATSMILVQVMTAKGSYSIEDVAKSRGMRSLKKEGVRSALVVPVRAGEDVLGVIQLGSRNARTFKPHEIHLFEAIGNQMGVAVQKARLYQQAEQRLRHAEALREIGISLTATHDPVKVLTRVAEEARRLTSGLFAFVVTPDKPYYKITAVAGDDKGYREVLKLSDDEESPYGQGPLGRSIRARKPVVCEDVLVDPLFRPWREIASARGIRSLVAAPLIVHDKPYGAVLSYAPVPRAYDTETMNLLTSLAAQAAAALENARLYHESRRKEEIQRLLKELNQDIASLDIRSLLTRLMARAKEFFKVDICEFRVLEEPSGTRVWVSSNPELDRHGGEGGGGPGRSRWIRTNRKPLLIPNLAEENGLATKDSGRYANSCGFIGVPVFSGTGEVIGVLRALTSEPREFTDEEVDLLQQLANGAAVALEKGRLFQETERRAQELATLYSVNAAVSGSLDLDEILQGSLDAVLQVTGMEAGYISFLEGNPPRHSCKVNKGLSTAFIKKLVDETRPGGKTETLVLTKRSFVLENAASTPAGKFQGEGITAAAWIPITSKDKVVGILNVSSRARQTFAPNQIPLLESIGAVLGAALEKARLYQESKRQAEIQGLLKELSQDVGSLGIQPLLKKITEKVREFFGVDVSDVRLIEKGIRRLVGVSGIEPERIRGTNSSRGRSKWILENRRPVTIEDTADEREFPTGETVRRLGLRGYLAVPLFSMAGEVIGVLRALTYQPRKFTQEEVDLLQQLANGAAVALENARLFEETQHRAREQETLNAIALSINQSLDVDQLLQVALDKVLNVTGRDRGYIRLMELGTGDLRLAAHRGISEEYVNTLLYRRTPGGKSAQVFESGEPLIINDLSGTILREETRHQGQQAIAWIPLKAKGKAIGVLNVSTSERLPFEAREVDLLIAIGNVIGVALENAWLFRETKSNLERIRLLRDIDAAIASILDLTTLLDLLMEKIDAALPYPTAITIRLRNKTTGALEPVACRNIDVEEWNASSGRKSRGPGNLVLEKNAPVAVPDVQTDPRISDRQFFQKYGLVSYFGIPLVAEHGVGGVIGFYTKEKHEFTNEEAEFLSTLAGQAAIAIYKCQLYEEIKTQARELALSNKVKDEFLSVMSHELRTPLTALMGYTALLHDGVLGEINPEQQQALGKVGGFSENLLTMIESIIDATKIETGAIVVEKFDVNLTEFLDEVKWGYEISVDRGVALKWDYWDDLPPIHTDPAKLKQILRQLINNGIKFAQKGQVTISARAVRGDRHTPRSNVEDDRKLSTDASSLLGGSLFVQFKVTDTGIGIPKELIPTIFDKFRQVDSSETRVYGGVGLGLYIVKTFIDLLGGNIEVESELVKGSTFTVTLPCRSVDDAENKL